MDWDILRHLGTDTLTPLPFLQPLNKLPPRLLNRDHLISVHHYLLGHWLPDTGTTVRQHQVPLVVGGGGLLLCRPLRPAHPPVARWQDPAG